MIVVLAIAVLAACVYWYTYPKFGHLLYHFGNALEAKLYGFNKTTVRLKGIDHKIWSNFKTDKPLLLLVHGFSANYAVWLRYAKHFKDDYHVVMLDLAGHGETGYQPEWDYSIAAQSARLADLITTLGHKNAHIVGNSMGGFIAAHMAVYFSEVCASIVLIDPAGVSSPTPSKMVQLQAQGINPFYIDSDADFQRFYQMVMAKPPYAPNIVKAALSEQYQIKKHQLMKIFKDFNNQHNYLQGELDKISCPSLLIWGAKDDLIDVSSAEVWRSGLNCAVHIWDDVGHMPMFEVPKRSALATLAFLQQQKSKAKKDESQLS
jgi:abhydrolase domain-containing protein 6